MATISTWKEKLLNASMFMLSQKKSIYENYKELMYKKYGTYMGNIANIIIARASETEYGESIESVNNDIAFYIYDSEENYIGALWGSIFEKLSLEENHYISDYTNILKAVDEKIREVLSEDVSIMDGQDLLGEYFSSQNNKFVDINKIIFTLKNGNLKSLLMNKEIDKWLEGQCALSVLLFLNGLKII